LSDITPVFSLTLMRYVLVLLLAFLIRPLVLSAQIDVRSNVGTLVLPESQPPLLKNSKSRLWQKALAAPIVLISAGAYATIDNDLIDRIEIQEERNEWMPGFRHHADDYLQYAPIAAVYGLNAFGLKGKNDFVNRSAILIKSELLMAALTFSLKKITAVPRPDTGQPTSFPSGHTAQAFAAATFMAKEYGRQDISYIIGAYSLATGIGLMRIMNNRHWMSDVLAGAGIGILSTNIVYLTHKTIILKRKKVPSVVLSPIYNQGSVGAYLILSI